MTRGEIGLDSIWRHWGVDNFTHISRGESTRHGHDTLGGGELTRRMQEQRLVPIETDILGVHPILCQVLRLHLLLANVRAVDEVREAQGVVPVRDVLLHEYRRLPDLDPDGGVEVVLAALLEVPSANVGFVDGQFRGEHAHILAKLGCRAVTAADAIFVYLFLRGGKGIVMLTSI